VEIIMLKDEVWEEINPAKRGWVCVSCMEDKLGREIKAKDLDLETYMEWEERYEKMKKQQEVDHGVAKFLRDEFPGIYKAVKKLMS
jgi:hypothetical protein